MHLVETWCPSIGLQKSLEVSLWESKFFKAVTVVFLFLFWHFFLLRLYVFCPFILVFFYTEWGFHRSRMQCFQGYKSFCILTAETAE